MDSKKVLGALLLTTMLITGCSSSSGSENKAMTEESEVKVDAGTLIGYKEDNIYNFKGIPYATANRFESPTAVTKYENGTQLALTYGEVAPQDRSLDGTGLRNDHEFMTPSNGTADMVANETCQYLNVWSKDLKGDKPVIVFFHGGGLNNGASSELSYYTGEYFVENEDAVFVSVNHRLNVLGYLDLSKYGDQYANSANVGMEDCVESLKWVKNNIANFGGNPDNVTIVGQSGGGQKVTTLACMSSTKDLFKRVFVMSGGYSKQTKEQSTANTEKLVKQLNLTDDKVISTLTTMDYENLLDAATKAKCSWSTTAGVGSFETPLFDNEGNMNQYAKEREWAWGTTYSEFNDNGGQMIYGGNAKAALTMSDDDALKALQETYGKDAGKKIADEYAKAYPDHKLCESLYLSQGGFLSRTAATDTVKQFNDAGVDVYNYVAAYTQPYFNGTTMHHTSDIPYWFNATETVEYMINGDNKNAQEVADIMSGALADFAKDGKPENWKKYTNKEHNTMVFDTSSECKVDYDTKLYKLIVENAPKRA